MRVSRACRTRRTRAASRRKSPIYHMIQRAELEHFAVGSRGELVFSGPSVRPNLAELAVGLND